MTPESKVEKTNSYNPQGTATATHDIRVEKHEAPHAALLKPLQETIREETITISAKEYKDLKAGSSLKILGLHFPRTTLAKDEGIKLAKTLATDNVQRLVAERAAEIQKKADAEKTIAIKKALDDAKKEASKKKKSKNLGTLAVLLLAIPITAFITWHLKKPRLPALAGAAATIVTSEANQNRALQWAFGNVEKTIFWVTSTPDQRILNQLQATLAQKPNLTVTIIATKEVVEDFRIIGRDLNVTTFGLTDSIGPINWLSLDNTLTIDATARAGIAIIPDPQKSRDIIEWADKELEPAAMLLWRSQ